MIMATIQDISTLLELENQKNSSLLKTVAFAQASHEFRNPLNAMISSLELMKDHVPNDLKYYKIAVNSSKLMLFLVNDVLDYAQIESQQMEIKNELANLKGLILECLELLKY